MAKKPTMESVDASLARWKTRLKRAVTAIDKLEKQRKRLVAKSSVPATTLVAAVKGHVKRSIKVTSHPAKPGDVKLTFENADQIAGYHPDQSEAERVKRGASTAPKEKKTIPNQAKLDAVKNLRSYDHCFISEAGVESFAQAFGVQIKATRVKANPKDPKGLTLEGGAKSAIGMDATVLAGMICSRLGVPYEPKMGRGFQLRACCDALEAHFSK